jgi:hypothetical protein
MIFSFLITNRYGKIETCLYRGQILAQWLYGFCPMVVCISPNGWNKILTFPYSSTTLHYMNDIRLDTGGDLDFKNGDMVIDDATLRHQEHIIIANKGEFKESPEIGVGIVEALNSESPGQVLTSIKRNFEYDGMYVKTLRFTSEGNIDADAEYKNE